MLTHLLPYVAAIGLAFLAGPVGFALGKASETDPSNLYLVVASGSALAVVLDRPDVREIGPYRAPFGRFVTIPPDFHTWLVASGYWVFPATALSELCGIQPTT